MPRKPTTAEEKSLNALRHFIREKSNLDCNKHSDMVGLQQKILKATGEQLSVQTLNRFFGLTRSRFHPASDTLDILCLFLGYKSFAEFDVVNKNLSSQELSITNRLITSIFSNMGPGRAPEAGLMQILKNLYRMLDHDERLYREIGPFMASTAFGRHYFFEEFLNMDGLHSHYGDGLTYYLLHAVSREEQLFANSLLCLRHFLAANPDAFLYYYQKTRQIEGRELAGFRPATSARYFAADILWQAVENASFADWSPAEEFIDQIEEGDNRANVVRATFIIGEALVLAREYEAAFQLLTHSRINEDHTKMVLGPEYANQFALLKLFSGFLAGRIHRSRVGKELDAIRERPFYFLSNDYYSIFQLILEGGLAKWPILKKNIDYRLDALIRKTGFQILSHQYLNDETAPYATRQLMEINGKATIYSILQIAVSGIISFAS